MIATQYAAILFLSMAACKKHHTLPKIPAPVWTVDDSGKYPATMTAVVQIPENLQTYMQPADKIGAFVGDECRGTGTLVKAGDVSVFFILIHGTASEQSKISFRYYRSSKSYLYATTPFLDFTQDGNYGTADGPKILDLSPVK
jgi:hypothetical protein